MLTYIKVHNLALMDHLEIDFHEGFSALTGETGAGKSILIESIGFVLGDRSNKDIIRNGETKAYVEAGFKISENSVAATFLKDNNLYDSDELIVYRDIMVNGRSSARINGTLVSVSDIKSLGDKLIDLHGQHAHQSLLNESSHLFLLDLFCGHNDLVSEMLQARSDTLCLRKEITAIENQLSSKVRRLQEIQAEIDEISKANLTDGEEEELIASRNRARYSSLIKEKLTNAYALLHNEEGALSAISAASGELVALSKVCGEYSEYASQMDSAYYVLEDVSDTLRDAVNSLSLGEDSLDEIESRLFVIENLKRKYGSSIADILAFRNSLIEEKQLLDNADDSLVELRRTEASSFERFKTLALSVSADRKSAAAILETKVIDHLHLMGIPSAQFTVQFNQIDFEELSDRGCEDALFLFSANKGSPLKSLAKTASGGEISRVMLAIKAALSQIDTIGTLVFDEIDTGISGMIAHTVAQEMLDLSRSHQVICVTHLPQIAAAADYQYYIFKVESDEKTVSKAILLSEEERPKELARIMGSDQTSAGIEHAKELLQNAKLRDQNIENK